MRRAMTTRVTGTIMRGAMTEKCRKDEKYMSNEEMGSDVKVVLLISSLSYIAIYEVHK